MRREAASESYYLSERATQINPAWVMRVDLMGPTVEFLTSPQEAGIDFCLLRGVIPPGVAVPLHSHPDTEDFIVISGEVQALRQGRDGYEWIALKAGDHVHVPGNARHAWRNTTGAPFVTYIITTPKLGKFFQEVGWLKGSTDQPVTAEDIRDFVARFESVAGKFGYWNGTPEENAAVGLYL
jgi:quercetin dioxygenase-like cupin family protein